MVRRKIPIEKIDDKNKLHICFSKRRRGLLKKAAEVSAQGCEVAVVVFSPTGKAYAYGHPDVDAVIDSYSGGVLGQMMNSGRCWWNKPLNGLGPEGVQAMKEALANLRRRVTERADYMLGEEPLSLRPKSLA